MLFQLKFKRVWRPVVKFTRHPSLSQTLAYSVQLNICTMTRALALQTVCVHCGSFFSTSTSQQFCCAGCEFVYGLITASGLDHYYKLKDDSPPLCPLPVVSSTANYDYCDDLVYQKTLSSDGRKLRFYIEGLNCTACLWLLEKLPKFCPDAEFARVDMSTSIIEVTRVANGSFAEIARTLNRFGYRPHPLSETDNSAKLQTRERRQDLVRIGIAGALTGNIMILAVSLYGGATGELASEFRWLSAELAAPVLSYCAWPFYRSALSAIRAKHLNLDVPIVVAILAGILMSCWNLITSIEHVYFDSLSMLVFLLLSSRLILRTIQNQQLRSTHLENELLLGEVRRITLSGTAEVVSSLALAVDDKIKIDVDRIIPVDGYVVSGEGTISAAVLTGESLPLSVRVGDYVEAGSQVLSGDWTLEVKNLPAQTRLAQILRDTETSSREKSNFIHFADRIASWFVVLVFLSALAVIGYFWETDMVEGASRALTLLIVTCPCVFGIAIPLSMSLAIRNAAKQGIIIKNGDSIERLWDTQTIVLDKTGTLTTGAMDAVCVAKTKDCDFSYALGLEQNQTHPVARAISRYLKDLGVAAQLFNDVRPLASGGVSGEMNGHSYVLRPVSNRSDSHTEALMITTAGMSETQKPYVNHNILQSDIGFFKNDQLVAKFALGDKLREESAPLISWIRRQGFDVAMVSGDRDRVVQACAQYIGLQRSEIYSEVIPEDKAKFIRSLGQGTVMIGDGVNDAMALAAADVGIAVCGSLDVSLRVADIYLTRNHLRLIPQLLSIARFTKGAIVRNLVFSACFNFISGTFAILGLMTPLWAAVLMPLSSITIVLSTVWTGNKIAKASVTL